MIVVKLFFFEAVVTIIDRLLYVVNGSILPGVPSTDIFTDLIAVVALVLSESRSTITIKMYQDAATTHFSQ